MLNLVIQDLDFTVTSPDVETKQNNDALKPTESITIIFLVVLSNPPFA